IAERTPVPAIERDHNGAVLEQFRESHLVPENSGQRKVWRLLACLYTLLGNPCLNQGCAAFGELSQHRRRKLFCELSLKRLDLLLKRFNRLFTYHHEKPHWLSPDSRSSARA